VTRNFRAIAKVGTPLLGVVALIGIAGCVLYTFQIRWQAESCLNAIRQLHVGSSTQEDARKALEPFHRFETDGVAHFYKDRSRFDYPTYTYRIENRGFHLLAIFNPAMFGAGVIFRDGIVISKGAGFMQEPFHMVNTRETVPGLMQNSSLDSNPTGMIVGRWDPPLKLNVDLDTRASEADRKAAFEYNLGCFTSILGCRSFHKILPGVKD
jgi:hypothetical protein